MGIDNITELSTHSIYKGATKLLSGQSGGPSAMSVCIRDGWSLGRVNDVYMIYQAKGDHFCGLTLEMLPLMQASFAASPATFQLHNCSLDEIYNAAALVYPTFDSHGPLAGLLQQCLASLAYNKDAIMNLPLDHCCRQTITLFYDAVLHDKLSTDVKVVHSWDDRGDGNHGMQWGSGIPPHVALMVSQQVMIHNQEQFIATFDTS